MAEEALDDEEKDEEDCPKCPPAGAPAWMATFADMATLLMAFFVLILSFAEFNVPKFKQISGSLKEAFGVQKVGSINSRFQVYKNPYMTENTILMGYRGAQFLETGAVYAPYIPLIMTPLVYDPNSFTPRKGVMTRYAKKMVRPEFYGKINVAHLNTL